MAKLFKRLLNSALMKLLSERVSQGTSSPTRDHLTTKSNAMPRTCRVGTRYPVLVPISRSRLATNPSREAKAAQTAPRSAPPGRSPEHRAPGSAELQPSLAGHARRPSPSLQRANLLAQRRKI